MNAKAKKMTNEHAVVNHNAHRVLRRNTFEGASLHAVNDATMPKAPVNERSMIKTIGMFLAAPFIGLAYVIALPAIGFYHLAKLALEAYAKRSPASAGRVKSALVAMKNVGLFFAAPFVALGYIIALPVVGFVMIARLAKEAHAKSALNNS